MDLISWLNLFKWQQPIWDMTTAEIFRQTERRRRRQRKTRTSGDNECKGKKMHEINGDGESVTIVSFKGEKFGSFFYFYYRNFKHLMIESPV